MRKILLNLFVCILMFLPGISQSAIINSGGPESFNFYSLKGLLGIIFNWFFSVAASIAAIGFAVAGVRMLINPTNSAERAAAKETFKKTIIGLLIALTSLLIVNTVVKEIVVTPEATRFLDN